MQKSGLQKNAPAKQNKQMNEQTNEKNNNKEANYQVCVIAKMVEFLVVRLFI